MINGFVVLALFAMLAIASAQVLYNTAGYYGAAYPSYAGYGYGYSAYPAYSSYGYGAYPGYYLKK